MCGKLWVMTPVLVSDEWRNAGKFHPHYLFLFFIPIQQWFSLLFKDNFQSVLSSLENLFAFFVLPDVRHHKM